MDEDERRDLLRRTFDDVAELYDMARPGYPEELVDDLVRVGEVPPRARLLEVGCGTGQFTRSAAARGFSVVCLEPGERLAAVARRSLSRFEAVQVLTEPFETWEPGDDPFDAVVAATSWHWLDPLVRYERAARALRRDGALAIVTTAHVLPDGGDPLFDEIQDAYAAAGEDTAPIPQPDEVADIGDEIGASGEYRDVHVRRYLWEQTYSADEYIAVLETYSGHRTMSPAARKQLYATIHELIAASPVRTIRKHYLNTLHVARRR